MNIRVLLRAVVLWAMAAASTTAFGATVTWDGGPTPGPGPGKNLWSNNLNWSTDMVPTSSDDVVITDVAGVEVELDTNATVNSITIQSNAELWIGPNRVLTVSSASTIDATGVLKFHDPSTYTGAGNLTVNGGIQIFGGTLGGSGTLTVNSGAWVSVFAANNSSTIARTTANAGAIVFEHIAAKTHFTFNGATLTNTGVIDIKADYNINAGAGSPIWNNNSGGVIRKSVLSGVTAINFPVNNAAGATIEAQSGHLYLNGGGTVSGAYSILSGSQLRLGPHPNTFAMSGNPTVSGAGELRLVGATLNLGAGVDVTVPNLALAFGTITGPGAVRVSGDFTWVGGTIAGSGARVLNGTSTPTIECTLSGGCQLDGATLQLQASATYSASTPTLEFSNGASMIIDAGKTFSITNDGDVHSGGGTPSSIVNHGTIWKKTTFNTGVIGIPLILSGTSTVDLDAGTLQFGGGGNAAAGATIDIAAGTTLEVTGGVFVFNSGAVSMPGSGDVEISAGTLRVPTGVTLTMPNVTLQNTGVIDGGGTLILSGTSTWAGGTMGSATASGGITQVNSGNTLNVTTAGARTLTQNRIVRNNGTLNLPAGGGINLSGSGTIENNGTLVKNTSGTSTIQPRVENNNGGTVSAATGTIALAGGGTAGGIYSISSGATLRLAGGTFAVATTGTVTGAGTLSIAGGTLDAGSGVDVTVPNVNFNSGTIAGAGIVRVSGNFTWSGGTITGSGARVLNSGSTPAISCSTGNCLLDGGTLRLQAWGTYSASSNSLVFSNGASLILDPGQVLVVNNDGDFVNGGGAASSITIGGFGPPGVNGCIEKTTTTGISIIDVPVTMAGSFKILAGTLQAGAGVTAAAGAIVHVDPGTAVEVTGGVFLFNSGSVSFPANGAFKVSGGTLRVPTGVTMTIPDLTLQGSGVIDGGGTLILSGTSQWHGGTMGSATAPGGITRINSGDTLSITSLSPKSLTQTRELLNDGTVNYGAVPPNHLTMSGNSEITNNGSLNLNSSLFLSGSALIENNGTITKTAASVNSTDPPINNNAGGAVNVNAGTLILYGGGTERGTFTIASGAKLIFGAGGGTFVMLGSPTVNGPGTFEIDGTVDVGDGPGGSADVFTVGAPFDFFGTLNLKDATLQASSTVLVAGTIEHYGGTISGSGTMTINSSGVLKSRATDSASTIAIDTAITFGGKLEVIGNVFEHGLSGNITVTNNGTVDFQSDAGLSNLGGAPQLVNQTGTLKKSAGSGTTAISVPVDSNAGSTIQAATGTLAFDQGATFTNVTISGAGTVALPATAAVSGTTTLNGKLRLTGNAAVSGTLNAAGTLLLDNGVNLTWPNVNLSAAGSKIDGAGTLNVSGNFTWSGGTITGSGARVLQSTSTPVIACSAGNCLLDGAALQLQASGTFSAPGTALVFSNGATLLVNPGKILTITNDGDFSNGGGAAGSVINNGTISKTTTAGTSTINVPVTTSGAFDVDTGTLQVAGGATVNAGAAIDIAAGAALEVTGGAFLFNSGSVSTPQNGDFKVSGGALRVPANITATIPSVTLQGSGVIDGGGTLILSGTSTWSGGTMGSATAPGGITRIDAGNTLNVTSGGGQMLIQGRELQNDGTLNVSGDITGTGTIDSGGTLNALADLTLGVTLNNSGQIAAIGTLALAGGGTHTGSFSVTAPGSLSFTSGAHSMSGGSIGGSGTLDISGATVTVGSPFTIGALSMSAGTATLDANGSADAFTMTGGTLGGAGILTLANGGTWSGGTLSGSGTTINAPTKVLAISAPVTLDGTLQNEGTVNVSGDITGLGTLDSSGTLNALANVTLSATVNNTGQVVTSNTLSLTGGGIHTGSFNVTTPGNLSFASGTYSLIGGGSIGGTGTLTFSGATATVGVPINVGTLSVSAGTTTLDANGSADAFSMTGGTFGGSGTLTLNNGGTWSGGTLSGSGTTINPATKILAISAPVTLDGTLQNEGTVNVSGDISGLGTLDSSGTLNAVADVAFSATVNNTGQVVTSNALSLTGGGIHTGSFSVTAPGNLSFASGTYSLIGGGSIGGTGTLTFSGATATVAVPINVGALSVSAGTTTLDANGSADAFTMTGGTFGGSGTLTLTNGGTWSGGTLSGSGTTINAATKILAISAPVTLDGTLQNDGTINVSGDISGLGTLDSSGTLNAVADLTLGVTMNNTGQAVTSNALSLTGGGIHTGSFSVTTPGNLSFASGTYSVSGGGSIGGTGTLTFNGATATIGVPVNVGALSVSAGTATLNANASADAFTMTGGTLGGSGMLTLNGGGTWSGGAWVGGPTPGSGTTLIPAAKTLSIPSQVTLNSRTLQNDGTMSVSGTVAGSGTIANSGTLDAVGDSTIGTSLNNSGQVATSALLSLGGNGAHTVNGTFTATAPGTIDFSGGIQTISGTLAGTGKIRFSGAAATVSGTWSGMPIEVTDGSVALDTNGTIPELTLSGGMLTGSGDITVSGPSTWSGGTVAGSGDFTFDAGATVAMPGTNAVTLIRPLLNQGTIDFTAASNGMLIDGVAFRNNGTFNIQSSQGIAATAGTPPFLNRGTLTKSSSAGVMQFAPPLSNLGEVRIESGTLHFGGNYAQSSGATTIVSGATLQTATLSLNGGILTGNGRVAGTLANNATVSPGASPGTLTITGDYVQSPDGALEIELAGIMPGTQYDRLLVSGNVTLGGTLDVTTSGGFTPAPGNAFQAITFGSRTGDSTFAVMNGLNVSGTALVPTFSATGLQLIANYIPVADVAVGVTGPVSTAAGTKVIYTVTLSNSGPDTATGITVTAAGSAGLTFSGNNDACVGSFPCSIGALGAGQSATIRTAWDIAPSATGSVQLTVNAVAAADVNPSNNSASASTNLGTCPIVTIVAPGEMISGETAEAIVNPFSGATYAWSIVGGTIDSGDGTSGITFTAGEPGTIRLAVHVTGESCTLGATFDVTVKPLVTCVGTAAPMAPVDGTVTADAVVAFSWDAVNGASGYRVWLEQDGAPARYLGTVLGTSSTKIIPPGTYRWYVETLFDGCASHESGRRALTVLPAEDCASRGAPELTAPAHGIPATSAAVAFSWNPVAQALEYELWLAPLGGVPTLIRTTSDTSYTAVVPPGRLEWYVRAIFGGCAATESARRVFTYTPPSECTSERPLLIAPLEGERLTSPVSFEWTAVSGATSYELYVDGELARTTTSPHAAGLQVPRAERRWQVRARLAEGCGAVDSAESRMVVIASPPSCAPLGAPVISAPAQISSGTTGRIQWSFVPGATAYVVEISVDPRFPRDSTSTSTVTARQLPFTFNNQSGVPVPRYIRVYAIDTVCVQRTTGAYSPVAVLSVLPPPGSGIGREGVALLTDPTDVLYTLGISADFAGQSFTATPTVPWLSVTPASGIVPPGGQTLRTVARSAGLPPGTSTGSIEIVTTAAAGGVGALATPVPVKLPVSISNIPGVVTAPKSTPPPEALTIPAVASVTNFIVRYNSDISVTNTSAQVMKYEIDFVPSGPAGMSEGQKTTVSLEPGATMAVNDIVATWFGGRSSTGTLEVRPLTEIDTSTSSAPVGGLANRTTFASSRTFSTTAAGGTYGQYIPAVPYANFVALGQTLSLQHVAQSDRYRTNLGLVEGSGEQVSLEVRIFDAAGAKRASFNVNLNGGERAQLNGVLAEHGVTLDDGRIEVEVMSGAGKVTAYASVLDNATNDPQLVPPVTLDHAGHSKWIVPGVADLVSGAGNWQTDVRIFNAGIEAAALTLAFYSMSGGPPTTRTIDLAAGEVRQLDRVLSFFAVSGDAGALHVSSAAPAQVVVTARTYNQTADGAYGQFIVAVTPGESVSAGSRPLQILQMEESERFRSNIGFAEVSGNPVTLEVAVFRPNSNDPAVLEVKLEPNQFQQLNSLLTSLGLGDTYNARISVRAIAGEGRALAYGSLIDQKTGDPTFIPGQ